MVDYNKVNVKLSNSQLNKLKTVVKNENRGTLRMNVKCLNHLPPEILLTTRQN